LRKLLATVRSHIHLKCLASYDGTDESKEKTMHKVIFAAAIGLAGFANAPAQAMPIAPLPASAPAVTLVSGGCGIGFHRGPYGGCRPNGYGGGVVGAPAYRYGYGAHGVYGYHGGYGYHRGYGYHGGYHHGYHGGYHHHYR
jgi:hypothetical protein